MAQTNQFMQALWFVADATLKEVSPKVKAKQERSRRMGEEVAAAIDAQLGISRPGADVSSKVDADRALVRHQERWSHMPHV